MNKPAILLPIHPKYMALILNGKKTLEVRKFNLPAGTLVYAYCTKGKPRIKLFKNINDIYVCYQTLQFHSAISDSLNGKVVASFVVGYCGEIKMERYEPMWSNQEKYGGFNHDRIEKESCLTSEELEKYGKHGNLYQYLYGLHISQLKIFDRPKELKEFSYLCDGGFCPVCKYSKKEERKGIHFIANVDNYICDRSVTKAPQSYCYVGELNNG